MLIFRNRAITSSGSKLSEKPVKPRRSQNSAVISRRWLSSWFSEPDATINNIGGRRRSRPEACCAGKKLLDALRGLLVGVHERRRSLVVSQRFEIGRASCRERVYHPV